MPRLSDSMEEGTIVRWLKQDGDEVARGDELVEIETDKATMTYEADEAGVLETVAGEGDTLPIGEVIARIGESAGGGGEDGAGAGKSEDQEDEQPKAEEAPADDAEEDEAAEEAQPQEPQAPERGDAQEAPAPSGRAADGDRAGAGRDGGERVKASPVARRIARERGVDIAALSGSGPGGRVVKADVEQAVEPQPASGGDGGPPAQTERAGRGEVSVRELSRAQQVIARRMAESKATVPDFTLQLEVDMEAAVEAREQFKAVAGDRAVPSLNDMVVKACALALRDFPQANGSYRDGRFELHGRVNVGVAVATDDGLVVPTIFDADAKPLGRIAEEARALAEKVRQAKISPPEVSNGTFTVSNLGMFGISSFTAVINPPQAAILAVGSVEARAVVRDGQLTARHTMAMTLGCDHRILYGADAARFLGRVRELLEHPAALAL